jgi:DNA polymerase-3 subunit epsilon
MAVTKDGSVVSRLHQLIRPDPCTFDRVNVSIHGITEADVADAPSFAQFWPTLWSQVAGPLVAHNAAFDMSALRYVLDRSGIPYPQIDYFCTCVIARIVWPDRPSYRLNALACEMGIALQHHNAEEDAYACALIAINVCQHFSVHSLHELQEHCELRVGQLFEGGYCPCGGPPRARAAARRRETVRAADIPPSTKQINASHPYCGKSFVFTGPMTSMPRHIAMQAVVDVGGICHDGVKRNTDFLVIGQCAFSGYQAGYRSGKILKAEQYRSKGLPIAILSENDFLSLL